MWQNLINAILGLWIILSTFLGLTADAMTTNLVIVGAVVAILGFWGSYSDSYSASERRHLHA